MSRAFHIVSHHAENPARVREFAKINEYHVSLLPHLLNQLKETPDGDGTMLDNSVVIYGSPMGNPQQHNHIGHDDMKSFGDSEGTFSWE